jgi:hypothetical protein
MQFEEALKLRLALDSARESDDHLASGREADALLPEMRGQVPK